MGKNFVLRGLSGRPAGFVMQAPGVLRFKAQGFAGRRVCLVALYADGTQAEFAGEMEEGENERADRGGCLSGAYLEAEGALLLYTDERARAAYEKNRTRERMRSFEKEERERRESRADGTADPSDSSKSNQSERSRWEREQRNQPEEIGGTDRGTGGAVAGKAETEKERAPEGRMEKTAGAGKSGEDAGGSIIPADLQEMHGLPQRRWPPPPCMPGARYVSGRWEG